MNRILIINLTRMGDLVQMLGLVGGLRRRWPQARIDVLAMKAFAGILDCFRGIDNVITVEDRHIVGRLHEDVWSGYLEVKQTIDRLNEIDYDLLVNPVVSSQAAYLAYPVKSDARRGMFISSDREQTIASEWTAFHLANEHHLGDRTFNLVDIFAHIGDVSASVDDFRLHPGAEAEEKAAAVWRQHSLEGQQVVGVHIGASRSNKAWETERFRTVIEKLLQNERRSVVLFGGYNELSLAGKFEDLTHPRFVNLIGKSGLKDLIAMLARLDLFVANDTGPMHLAASAKTPVLNLSLGPVSLWETGPYLPGSVVMQADIDCHPCSFDHICDHLDCHRRITPEAVCETIEAMLAGRTPQQYQGMHVWRTRVDPFGMLHCVPAQRRAIGERELYFECKRAVWAVTLLSDLDPKVDWVRTFRDDLASHYLDPSQDLGKRLQQTERLHNACRKLAESLKQLAQQRPDAKNSIDRIRDTWSDIKRQKDELFALARDVNDCYDFFLYARFRESSLLSDDFRLLTRETLRIYAELALQLQVLTRLIRSYHNGD